MDESIIIFTKYYSEAVVEVLNEYDLNISIICLSSYEQVLEYVKTTPNIRGVVFLENKPSQSVYKAYSEILTTLDEIAEASKQPLCVSILCNTDTIVRIIGRIKTTHIDITHKKFALFNTDLLKYEGIATVIANTVGIMNQTILLELYQADVKLYSDNNKLDLLKTCMLIATIPLSELDNLSTEVDRFPELQKLRYLRENSDKDDIYLKPETHSIFNSFYRQCIERRKQDEMEVTRGY